MASSTYPSAPSVAMVDQMRHQISDLLEVLWAARTPAEQLGVVTSIEKIRSTLDAVELKVIAEIDATNAAASQEWGSTKDFLTAVTGGHRGSGAALVRLAKALTTDRERVCAELAAGRISRLQAQIIVKTIDALPVKPELRTEAEEVMLHHAQTMDASDLLAIGRELIAVIDPEGDERAQERKLSREERAAHLDRFLSITNDGAGGVRIKGRTTVEDAEIITAALSPLSAPLPSEPSACGGSSATRSGECGLSGCAHDGRDPRQYGARMLDALVDACDRLLDTDVLPDAHGSPVRINLTMSYTDLRDGIGVGALDTGQSLSASAVRRLSCDCELIPMVLGSHSEILDVGRLHRLVTAAIWKALVVRDRHCTFPGCTRPPIACDAHHITHWIDGGGTGLNNLALLCRNHHTMIHNTPWQIRLNPIDRHPEFIPPARLDPEQRPMRARRLRD